ncbi:MAG: stage V sporulation protein E [Thermoanaerobacteraceae bacterium]|nr:stage V sporulation protein E [Thermoanaerobacteraceae bacterium]
MPKKGVCDYNLLMIVTVLLAIGIVMVFSASSVSAYFKMGDPYYFLKRQLLWGIIGYGVMIFFMNYEYWRLKKYSNIIMLVTICALGAVLIPGIGIEINEARRWLGIGGITIQPSEIAKIGVVLFMSARLSENDREKLHNFFKGLVPYLLFLGIIFMLIVMEPNLSTAGIILIVGLVILYTAGARISHIVLLIFSGIGLASGLIASGMYEHWQERILGFLDPWSDVSDTTYQIIQSLYALGSGGLFGVGLGKSREKLLYIPEPQSDFIFSIIGEELGFIGTSVIVILFVALIIRGLRIAARSKDLYAILIATGITSIIGIQALMNIAVVTSSMPVTGVPLPFISAGGSSMVFTMAGVGILLNISRYIE